jgi:hypothetical protein
MQEQIKQEVVESPQRDPQVGFDMRVEIVDAKTGKLLKYQPYVRHAHRDKGVVYERDGKFYYENGIENPNWAKVAEEPKAEVSASANKAEWKAPSK